MSVRPLTTLADTVARHQRGELSQTAQPNPQIVSAVPNNAEASHLLGQALQLQPRLADLQLDTHDLSGAELNQPEETLGCGQAALPEDFAAVG